VLIKFTHISFKVYDLEESSKFYLKYCQLEIIQDRRETGGNSIWLGHKKTNQIAFILTQSDLIIPIDHIGFQIEQLDQLDEIERMANEDDSILTPVTYIGGLDGNFVMIKDPSGHIIEFTHGQPILGI
jgi:lactoylglutathione lyase